LYSYTGILALPKLVINRSCFGAILDSRRLGSVTSTTWLDVVAAAVAAQGRLVLLDLQLQARSEYKTVLQLAVL
jgi:hypothetical protein